MTLFYTERINNTIIHFESVGSKLCFGQTVNQNAFIETLASFL
jgi:hypothetical protein